MTARAIWAAAALALLAGSAWAETENTTEIAQSGAQNLAIVDQTGSGNVAGHVDLPMQQSGHFNRLEILQGASDNRIGDTGAGLRQIAPEGSVTTFNSIEITQRSAANLIGQVLQLAAGALPWAANRLSVLQEGGEGNSIARVVQIQQSGMPGQSAVIEQDGENNRLSLVQQISVSAMLERENRIEAHIRGSNNAASVLRGYAARVNATSGQLRQSTGTEDLQGNGNVTQLEVQGDGNDFAIRQRGRLNSVGQVTVLGDDNSIGIDQDGTENDVILSLVEGNGNEIGLIQLGTNTAELVLIGTVMDNRILIDQMGANDAALSIEGDRNDFQIVQGYFAGLKGDNTAEIVVTGSDNRAELLQEGSNSFQLRITGDRTNDTTGLSSAPALGLVFGRMEQRGTGNEFDGNITGDRNLIGLIQAGTGNAVLLQVQGDANEALFLQDGAGNRAQLSQTGIGNRATILQY